MNISWESSQYGEDALVGRVNIGGYHLDATRPKGSDFVYKATCRLPGIKSVLANCKTQEEAKLKVALAWEHWSKMLTENKKP